MKTSRTLRAAAFAVFAAAICLPLSAQDSTNSTTVHATNLSSPAVVQQKPAKAEWMKCEVVHADRHSIVVREEDNNLAIHTFTYGPAIQSHMESVADQGGFQSGDKVKILYKAGDTIALKIHGKPSKAS